VQLCHLHNNCSLRPVQCFDPGPTRASGCNSVVPPSTLQKLEALQRQGELISADTFAAAAAPGTADPSNGGRLVDTGGPDGFLLGVAVVVGVVVVARRRGGP